MGPTNSSAKVGEKGCCVDNCPMNHQMKFLPHAKCSKCGHPTCILHVQHIKGRPLCWCFSVPFSLKDYANNAVNTDMGRYQGFGLITKNLSMDEPLAQTPDANNAIESEVQQLQKKKVFDLHEVMEWEDAIKQHPDAIVANLDLILGIKNWEGDISFHVYKARGAMRGNNVKGAQGQKFYEPEDDYDYDYDEDLYVVPVGLGGARFSLVYGYSQLVGLTIAADVVGAYLEAPRKGPPPFARLGKRMRPREWKHYRDPVCCLWRACYGFGRAHFGWNTHADGLFIKVGMANVGRTRIYDVEGTTYVLRIQTATCLITLYVDDLLISGQRVCTKH